jgi:3-dehydroquinate synthase
MKRHTIKINFSREPSGYDIVIGDGLLSQCGEWARKCLGKHPGKIVIVSNPRVFGLYGKQTEKSLRSAGYHASHFLMKDGERHKTLRTAEAALKVFAEAKLSRTDAVVALGGGVVGDLAGFTSATHLRGIPYLQIPTTLLSMIDASVGGKTGVNTASGKNLIGAFHQPRGVLIDVSVLKTLPRRELTAGLCEAIKQGAVGGGKLLVRTGDLLSAWPIGEFSRNIRNPNFKFEISNLISAHVQFKARIVAGDPQESAARIDSRSRKILNFGHTFGHALEKVTNYKRFCHGEAVGYGILFAAELSKTLALCADKDVNLLYDVVHRAGTLPRMINIDASEIFQAMHADKKNLAGSLQMVLLKGIGRPVILTGHDVPQPALKKALKRFLQEMA